MPLRTKMTTILGIEHPVMMGGMHYVGYATLAAAVSNAGGLGVITALTQPSPEALQREIRQCRSLTNKPFGVNLTLLPALAPPNYDAYCDVIIQEGVKIIETAGRNPGCIVIHKCVAVKHALTAERLGADFVSVDGFECAGHPGESDVGNFILIPAAVKKLKIPVIASGGCATGSQLAAVLCFGAVGMNCGTRFMATIDCGIQPSIKQALVAGDETSTMLLLRPLKNTERVYANKSARMVAEIEKQRPGDIDAIRQYIKGDNYRKSFYETGDVESSVWSCGQSMGLIDDIPSVASLIHRLVQDAEAALMASVACIVVPAKL